MKRVLLVSLGPIAMASYVGCLPAEEHHPHGNWRNGGQQPQGRGGTTGAGNNGVAGTTGNAGTRPGG